MMAKASNADRETYKMAFYELRQYHVRPGKIAEWLKLRAEEIIPFQVSTGMVITGSFRGETDESVYVWMRRFESEAQREALYKAVYDTDFWKNRSEEHTSELQSLAHLVC